MTEYTTYFCGDKYEISANFAQASDTIFTRSGLGEWIPTQYQVADFRHDSDKAMRCMIDECIIAGGDKPEDFSDEIEEAIKNIV